MEQRYVFVEGRFIPLDMSTCSSINTYLSNSIHKTHFYNNITNTTTYFRQIGKLSCGTSIYDQYIVSHNTL